MPFPIDRKLVVAVSSSAVFDMVEADNVFRAAGEDAYREYQSKNVSVPFEPGVAFPFIKRLLRINTLFPLESPIEVVVLSRNDPDSGRRFFRSCRHHHLDITRGAFLTGRSPYAFAPAFNASLFLSANPSDVESAVKADYPAGLVLPTKAIDVESDLELRIAFDFDGVLADDEAEKVFAASKDVQVFHNSEETKVEVPHAPGPLKELFAKISELQALEQKRVLDEPGYSPIIRVAIVTARNAPSNERLVTTLNSWGISAAEVFFMGGIEKRRVLDVLKPHIFFDDQLGHLSTAAETVPSVHIPFGVANIPLQATVQPIS